MYLRFEQAAKGAGGGRLKKTPPAEDVLAIMWRALRGFSEARMAVEAAFNEMAEQMGSEPR